MSDIDPQSSQNYSSETGAVSLSRWQSATPTQKLIFYIGVPAIVVLVLLYVYASYAARHNYERVAAEAEKAQREIELLKEKRDKDVTMDDWQTGSTELTASYRNEEFGFEFKYPNDWYVEPGDLKLGWKSYITGSPISGTGFGDFSPDKFIDYSVKSNPESLSLESWTEKHWGFSGVDEIFNIADTTGLRRSYTSQIDNESGVGIAIIKKDKIYEFGAVGDGDIKVLNQILSTFKFTDTDNRILLNPKNINQYNDYTDITVSGCNEKFNSELSNTTVTYTNKEKGISFEVPYNNKWGSDRFRINPFDEYNDAVRFGPIGVFEGCGWIRFDAVYFTDVKSAEEIVLEIEESRAEDIKIFPDLKPRIINFNGFKIVKYTDFGLCSYPTMIVIGTKSNYQISPICSGDFKEIEELVKTFKFIY